MYGGSQARPKQRMSLMVTWGDKVLRDSYHGYECEAICLRQTTLLRCLLPGTRTYVVSDV